MSTRTEITCKHTHTLVAVLDQSDYWLAPPTMFGGRRIIVTSMRVEVQHDEPLDEETTVRVGGVYAKIDGSPSKTHVGMPQPLNLADLPHAMQQVLLDAAIESAGLHG